MDQLSITRDAQTRLSRVKFDLDLPSAAEDDTPIGDGLPLPEWDYRTNTLQPDHCRLQPMIARDAAAAESTGSSTITLAPCVITELNCCCCLVISASAFW